MVDAARGLGVLSRRGSRCHRGERHAPHSRAHPAHQASGRYAGGTAAHHPAEFAGGRRDPCAHRAFFRNRRSQSPHPAATAARAGDHRSRTARRRRSCGQAASPCTSRKAGGRSRLSRAGRVLTKSAGRGGWPTCSMRARARSCTSACTSGWGRTSTVSASGSPPSSRTGRWWRMTTATAAPAAIRPTSAVPFYLTNRGYGVLVNETGPVSLRGRLGAHSAGAVLHPGREA